MKNLLIIFSLSLFVTGCASYRRADLGQLTIGMTKWEVSNTIGPPERVLAVNRTQYGYQEVLEYRTYHNEYYALEFWDDYLTGIEFLYDGIVYVPAPAPPTYWPVYGRPVFPGNYRPSRPQNPQYPGQTPRPPTTNPGTPQPGVTNRPESTSRPQTNTQNNSRPSTNNNNNNNSNTNNQQNNTPSRQTNNSRQTTTTPSTNTNESSRQQSSGESQPSRTTNGRR
ncbi:MAG: hypothetical protein LUG18_16000 [Candidatus Azobacteroides sp.]|nr:hypothetical protein [Candidatus Azobacteroides sp.]